MSWNPLRSLTPRSALPAAAVLLVLAAGAAAHANRPEPFGDQVAEPGAGDASPVGAQSLVASGVELRVGPGLEAYAPKSGEHLWSYRRENATALYLAMAGDDAVVLWDDGMITSVHPSDHAVRWHRSVPGLAEWLRADGEPGAGDRTDAERKATALKRAAAALHTASLDEPWVAVVTPSLTMGFRDRDGDLRFNSRPPTGCSYDPLRAVHTDDAVLVPRLCTTNPGSGRPLPGGITVFRLADNNWQLNAGPDVKLTRVGANRVSIDDGPIVGTHIFDTTTGTPETTCGNPAEPFAALTTDPTACASG